MSEDKSSKTEAPTDKKLEDARKEGNVAKSNEVINALSLLLAMALLWGTSTYMLEQLVSLTAVVSENASRPFAEALPEILDAAVRTAIVLSVPVIALSVIGVVIGSVAQTGILFTPTPVKPDASRLNPVNGAKQLFGKKHLLEQLLGAVKIMVLMAISFIIVWLGIQDLLLIPYCGLTCLLDVVKHNLGILLLSLIPLLVGIALIDFVIQRRLHMQDLRMSKDEVKKEARQTEGNPELKQERQQIRREDAQEDLNADIQSSTVIILGSGVCAGIHYKRGETPVPVLTLRKHGDELVQIIAATARRNGIPVVRNQGLAERLASDASPGKWIPNKLFTEVARVLTEIRGE